MPLDNIQNFEHDERDETLPPGEETVRFVRNFNDIFLSMGIIMFAIGISFIATFVLLPMTGSTDFIEYGAEAIQEGELGKAEFNNFLFMGGVTNLILAAIMWALGEVVARKRRLFLPSIAVMVSFTNFMVTSAGFFFLRFASSNLAGKIQGDPGDIFELFAQFKTMPLALFSVATLSILAFYIRTKLPFAMGVGSAALAGVVISTIFHLQPDLILRNVWLWGLFAGLFLFVLGMFFDARDPSRQTRFADNGFWLHFIAGPVIFFSVKNLLTGAGTIAANDGFSSIVTLAIVVVFAIISLLINRRALLVSGILSAVGAVWQLVGSTGSGSVLAIGITFALLGSIIVILGSAWSSIRRVLIGGLPKTGFIGRIIPPETVID